MRNKNQSVPTAHRIVINDTEGIDDIVVMLAGISILTQKEPAVSLEEGAGAFFRMMPGTENILACSTGAAVVGGKESDFKIACVDALDTRGAVTGHICGSHCGNFTIRSGADGASAGAGVTVGSLFEVAGNGTIWGGNGSAGIQEGEGNSFMSQFVLSGGTVHVEGQGGAPAVKLKDKGSISLSRGDLELVGTGGKAIELEKYVGVIIEKHVKMLGVAGGTSKKDAVMAQGFPAPLAANSTSIKLITEAVQEVDKGYFHFGYMYQASAEGGEALGGSTASDGTENLYFAGDTVSLKADVPQGMKFAGWTFSAPVEFAEGQQCGGCGNELCDARTGCNGNSGLSGGRGNAAAHAVPHARGPCPGARGGCRAEAKPQNRRVKQKYRQTRGPVFKPGPRFLYRKPLARRVVQKKTNVDNGKKKTPFAILGVRSGNCTSKQREVIEK